MDRIIIYYCMKVTLKGIVKRDIVLLRKSTRKPKGIVLTLLAKRKPYATRTFAKSRTKIKNKILGNFFPGKLYIWMYGSVSKNIHRCFLGKHKNYFKNHPGGL